MNSPTSFSQINVFLSEWSEKDEFSYSTKPTDWEKQARKFRYVEEGYAQVPYYYAFAISYLMEKTGCLILSSCKKKWDWAQGLVALVPEVNWDVATFHQVIVAFGKKPTEDIGIQLSYATGLFCKKDFDKGLTLMKTMPEKTVDCLSGLMMNDFNRTCELFPPNKDNEQFAQAFIRTENLDNDTVRLAYDIAVSFEEFSDSTALTFFFKALSSLDDKRKEECEDIIKGLFETKSSSLIVVLCNWLLRQETLSFFVEDCILLALAHLEHPKEDVVRLDGILCYRLVNIELFTKMAAIISETYEPELVLSMGDCLQRLRKDDESFAKLVLLFVLHPKGAYRIAGRKMWDEFHVENSSFDPLSLSEEEQIMFIMFMLQDLGNPDLRLPKILPLFLSPSERVRLALLTQMVPYVDNYMGHVTQAMDKLGLDTEETRQLKQYVENRGALIQKRRELKELSPVYAQYRYYQEACRVEREEHSQHVKAIEEESSFLWMKMLKTEVLARGGGWRMDNGKTQHLAKIEVSVPSRLMVQSMTPLELAKWIGELYKDWDVTEGNH